MSKRYLVLGGGCSFAVHLCRYLLSRDAERVVAVGRSEPKSAPFLLGLDQADYRYSYYKLHTTYDRDVLLGLIDRERPDTIVNFAAQGESAASFEQSWRYFETNCVGMTRLVEDLQGRDYLQRFVNISSGEVYGSADHPVREDEPTRPTSPYAASKAAFDAYLVAMAHKRGLRMNIVRPANTYGEGQQLYRFIPKAVVFGLTGQRVPLYGSGHGVKSYLHSEDLARAIYLLTEHAPLSRIYNIAPRMPVSMRDIAEEIAKQLDLPISTLCEDVGSRRGTDAKYWFDASAAERDFGFVPSIGLQDGIARVINWAREHLDALREVPTQFEMRA